MRMAIPPSVRLAITLRFLATGCSYEDLKFSIAVSPQSIGHIVIETCEVIIKVLKPFIKLPETSAGWMDVAEKFYERSMFPNCVGSLDGKHVNIIKPSYSGSFYFNYKKTFSIVLMAIVDSNSEFLMVDVGANGRISDGGVFSSTKFFEKLENDELNLPDLKCVMTGEEPLPFVFVSDAAFTLRTNILKPLGHVNLTEDEMLYNKTLSSARVKVENPFGILSSRFRVLRTCINLSPEKATVIVLACCYLHNYLRRRLDINFAECEQFLELPGMAPTVNKNTSQQAKEVRQKIFKAIKKLKAL